MCFDTAYGECVGKYDLTWTEMLLVKQEYCRYLTEVKMCSVWQNSDIILVLIQEVEGKGAGLIAWAAWWSVQHSINKDIYGERERKYMDKQLNMQQGKYVFVIFGVNCAFNRLFI